MKAIDITGQKFGRLTAVKRLPPSEYSKRHGVMWECICDCGQTTHASCNCLRSGRRVSCGCLRRENATKASRTHGKSRTRLYTVWMNMMSRCFNRNHRDYPHYGGRGITVCGEWRDSAKFFQWAGDSGFVETKGRNKCTLDRMDNDGNYEPENCRWTTQKVQNNNKRSNIYIEIDGKVRTMTEWAEENGIDPKLAQSRIARGTDEVLAVTAKNLREVAVHG